MKRKLLIAFSILGLVGVLLLFTPLNKVLVPMSSRGKAVPVPVPIALISIGFGVAGAIIEISFKNQNRK